MRLSSVTTKISPDRAYSSTSFHAGLSIREPVIFSENILPQPACFNASSWESRFWPTLLTRA